MVVATDSPVAVKARKGIMEFLLVNHPLDCPVCDEGGECQLQDLAFAFGADFSRMNDAKRTFVSEDLGPVVKKEANRCIVCMRCVRYCDEIMGEDALTAHQRGVRSEISSFDRRPLECEQCGNCIEVCPVGALTALPYRFKARPWDLRQHITVCPWCSNGCSVRLGVRGMEILRARGTERRGVNQEYLCVRGRFGYGFVNDAARLTSALLRASGRARTRETRWSRPRSRRRSPTPRHGCGRSPRATARTPSPSSAARSSASRSSTSSRSSRAPCSARTTWTRARAWSRRCRAPPCSRPRAVGARRSRSRSWAGRRRCWSWATTCRARRRSCRPC